MSSATTSAAASLARAVYGAARAFALFGVLVLCALALMSLASIVGRALIPLGLKPVPGDFELVEMGTALAVFSFLPWCHLRHGHAVVDLFWGAFPPALKRALQLFADLLMLVVWALLVWRMGVGALEYRAKGELTFILQMPIWWGYALSMVPAALGVLVALWRVLESAALVPAQEGAGGGAAHH
ncbi:MAG: TRAP transporter small permease [Burkholderiaceae bacterium]|nr:TRAP transporter small permease [Burkholderiaceae bacterium]